MLSRLLLTLINIIFPPLTVLLLTGPYTDTLLNCILFLCGVIPSHIHGFYISCTYFHRKNKVKKGRWPGGAKSLIFDESVWRGGASRGRVEELRAKDVGKRRSRHDGGMEGLGQRTSRGSQLAYRGDRRSQMTEQLGPRRSVMGEISGKFQA